MEATLIYPHQLFKFEVHPALAHGRPVYLIEEPLLLTHNPIHRTKLLFHRMSMQTYKTHLISAGYHVTYLDIREYKTTKSIFKKLKHDGVTTIHVVDTTDDYLERALGDSGLTRITYDSPLFILSKAEAMDRYVKSKRFMANFYKKLRQDTVILMEDGEPIGGAFSFDVENRNKLPKGIIIPADITDTDESDAVIEAKAWLNDVGGECYGEVRHYLPTTHAAATVWLRAFLKERLNDFGPYEDAMTESHTRVYHSLLSPLMNVGLLTAREIVDETLAYHKKHPVPIASLEGFIRQIIGWREFIRASYEVDGRMMRTKNFFGHTRKLSDHWWNGTTGLLPADISINRALSTGYTHHIERLMVLGNLMLLAEIHPDEVYRWFMGMYVDAYDWVMVPNVYGMSQFADGGSFATKPYISGSSYIKKMSDYPKGDWEATWTALYWHFIAKNETIFLKNHRLAMMPRLWAKMSRETRNEHLQRAQAWLNQTS